MEMNEENPFDIYSLKYDSWYDDNESIFKSELSALSYMLKKAKKGYSKERRIDMNEIHGLEIGVGSGRFGSALCIGAGIDPSENMLKIASGRGIQVIQGVGENLPFAAETFDYTAFFTSVCFLDDPLKAFAEAYRVTRDGGFLLCSFLNRGSDIGREMEAHKKEDVYFKNATFFTCEEITRLLKNSGYAGFNMRETIFMPVEAVQKHKNGIDKGLYGIILAWKA